MIIKFSQNGDEPPMITEPSEEDGLRRLYQIAMDVFSEKQTERYILGKMALFKEAAEDYVEELCIKNCKIFSKKEETKWSKNKMGYDYLIYRTENNKEIPAIGYKIIKFEVCDSKHHAFEIA